MTIVTEEKRPRAKKEQSALDDLTTAADILASAIAGLSPAEAQSLNAETNGNHGFTVADAAKMAEAVKSSASKVKKGSTGNG